jgi:FlaA1/EpsC-like NDP-sugar epimerase
MKFERVLVTGGGGCVGGLLPDSFMDTQYFKVQRSKELVLR